MPDLEGWMRRLTRAGAVTVVAALLPILVLTGCNGLSAGPSDPPPPTPSSAPTDQATPDTWARAARMDKVINQIYAGREDRDIPGFAGLSVDEDTGTIDLHWVGDPPGRIEEVVAGLPRDVTVTLHPAAYDMAAMLEAVEDVVDEYGAYLHSAGPANDGSGIEIEQTADARRNGPSLKQWAKAAGMPVKATITEPPQPAGTN